LRSSYIKSTKVEESVLVRGRRPGEGKKERVIGFNMLKYIIGIYENVTRKPIILYNYYIIKMIGSVQLLNIIFYKLLFCISPNYHTECYFLPIADCLWSQYARINWL
jgi:hypothetical protein